MGSATTDFRGVPSAADSVSPPSVLSLEALREMTSQPDGRCVIRGVDWAFYERLVDSIPEGANIHLDYDGKDLEVMGKGPRHERIRELLGYLVRLITEELEIPSKSLGETTWKRPAVGRGLEADQCYYFLPEKLELEGTAQASGSDDIADYPNPDLAVEVDISVPLTDRASIYAALEVAEVWRFVGDQVVIERLGDDRSYHPVDASGFLLVRAAEVKRWIVEEDSRIDWAWARQLRAWVRAELAPRKPR
jgi:Uma2 family endonuclease